MIEPRPDLMLDARVTRRMSAGMRAYVRALVEGLPRVAPDLRVVRLERGENASLSEQVLIPLEIAAERPRLVHFPTFFVPLVARAGYILTVHDLLVLKYPEMHARSTVAYYRSVVPRLARRASRLCMGDERTLDDCVHYLGVEPERCRVIPLGYDRELLEPAEPLQIAQPFFFYAGNHRKHKNLKTLFEAWARLRAPVDLYLTGPNDFGGELERYRRANARIVTLGDVPRAHLYALYRAALAYVHPALSEGFGIPMLEAAAVGTPVIAATQCVPRILAAVAACVPAQDPAAWHAALQATLDHPAAAKQRALAGVATARAYTWDRFAASTAGVYREMLDETVNVNLEDGALR